VALIMSDSDNRLVLAMAKGTEAMAALDVIIAEGERRNKAMEAETNRHLEAAERIQRAFAQSVDGLLARYNVRIAELTPADADSDNDDNEG
jgi:hypothetical protein